MAKSSVTVTFNSLPLEGEAIVIDDYSIGKILSETFQTLREGTGESIISSTTSSTAYNYAVALNLDWNSSGVYNIYSSGNVVVIEATLPNATFAVASNTTLGKVSIVVNNKIEAASITIDDITYAGADYDCNYIEVSVTTSELATSISSPIVVSSNVNNPFNFEWVRGTSITIQCTNGNTVASSYVRLPDILSAGNISVSLFNTPSGANATVSVSNTYGLTLQYSLDNVTWQSSNIFNGLVNDTYTIYVKDQFDCYVSNTFEVTIFTPDITLSSSFSYLAKEMSIRFKKNVSWDNYSVYKNEENTLSCEEKINSSGILYPYYQKFQTVDIITTQFLSNYANIEANILKEDGTKEELTIVKKSENLNIKDYRDAIYYKYSDTQLGVYFTSGDKYDYTTGLSNGTYTLNGALPTWGVVGNYIEINTLGWFRINAIDYDDTLSADILVLDYVYNGEPTIEKVGSIYNFKNYEVYEFEINFFNYDNQYLQVEILQSDDVFGEYNYLSEIIEVKENHENTIEIKWYNPTDTYVFYSTGLVNKGRFDFSEFSDGNESTVSVHSTSDTTILLDSRNYEVKTLIIEQLSTSIMRQLTEALLHKEVYIDSVKYITNNAPESENVQNTNLYSLTATLTKAGNVFNSEFYGVENEISNEEVIGLLQSNTNYINIG